MKKILFTGSFCSGKSTVSRFLNDKLPNSILIPEVTREILKLFGKVDWSIPELRDYILIKQLIEEKKAFQTKNEYVIVDSGIISFLAHDNALIGQQPRRGIILEYFTHQPYDYIFVCDHTDISIFDDGERYTDKQMQKKIYDEVLDVLNSLNLNYKLISGAVDKRVNDVTTILNPII